MAKIEVYSTKEVAEILGVSLRTIYNYIKAGELNATKIGRTLKITGDELERFIHEGTSSDYYKKLYDK